MDALRVAEHMTHSLSVASKYYKRARRPAEAAETGGLIQRTVRKQPAQTVWKPPEPPSLGREVSPQKHSSESSPESSSGSSTPEIFEEKALLSEFSH